MKETGMLFSAPMVRAILEGRKTQTRRVLKNQRAYDLDKTPFGQPGDRIYVRETWMDLQRTGVEYRDDSNQLQRYAYAADTAPGSYGDECRKDYGMKWRPSIHIPKSAARIWLEVTGVRVERLQNITDADALAEGVDRTNTSIPGYARERFRKLWESTGGNWEANHWVWIIDFKVLSTTGRPT